MAVEPEALKLSFQLTARGERLEVRVTAPRGEGRAETAVPSPALLSQLAEYDPVHMPLAVLQSAGQSLYQSLIVGDVAKLAADVLQEARASHQPAQFELRFDPDQVALAQHPWEILADDLGQFLVRDGLVDVTRYITYPQPPPPLRFAIQEKLLLRVVSQPAQLPPLTVAELPVSCQTLAHATFELLSERLLIERLALWGLQFDGHGSLVQRCHRCDAINWLDSINCSTCGARLSEAKQVGVLAFEANDNIEWVPAQEFGSILYNAQVQLAVLLACETARLGDQWIFSGLAPSLVLAGVPAVIGMQYPVSDRFANSFATSFYKALLQRNDLLEALRIARQMHVQSAWYSPVLYLRHRKAPQAEETIRPAYHTRNVDTAVPAQVQEGSAFLVRLWIRRPQTQPLTTEQLREELNVPAPVPIRTRESEAEIKFEPIPIEQHPLAERRKLRRGEVEVRLSGTDCRIMPESIKLFVDEDLDAPPAIFTVRAQAAGSLSLIFSLWQDGGQIASETHHVQVMRGAESAQAVIRTGTYTVPVESAQPVEIGSRDSTASWVGKTLGQYQIIEEIGRGGMAVVYKAYQPALQRYVAIKVLPAHLCADTEFVRRFQHEALAAARLRHPNIVMIHDVGSAEGVSYVVMELIEGESLALFMRRSGAMRPDLAASILAQVASALDYAHAHGFVHRDIQPSNIVLSANGHVTLTDFGIAKAMSGTQFTQAGMTIGAPAYMSPEQAQGETVDYHTDIYSLGVVLFEMLTGTVPFARSNPFAVMMAHATEVPPSVSQLNPAVPRPVEAVVLRAMAKDREQRYQSAGQLAQDLQMAMTGQMPVDISPAASARPAATAPSTTTIAPSRPTVSAHPVTTAPPATTIAPKPGPPALGRNRTVLLVLAGVSLAILVLLCVCALVVAVAPRLFKPSVRETPTPTTNVSPWLTLSASSNLIETPNGNGAGRGQTHRVARPGAGNHICPWHSCLHTDSARPVVVALASSTLVIDDFENVSDGSGLKPPSQRLYPNTHLFEPIQVNGVKIKNRIVMGPMGNINMADEMGRPSKRMIAYFAERAKGGVGLITSGIVPVSQQVDPSVTEPGDGSYFPRVDKSRTVLVGWRTFVRRGGYGMLRLVVTQVTIRPSGVQALACPLCS